MSQDTTQPRTKHATVRLNDWELATLETALERWHPELVGFHATPSDTPLAISLRALHQKLSQAVTK